MRVLLIKTSSLGDVIHTLPALTDAQRAIPDIRFDWVVEEAFAEIPRWHPAVDQVIPVAMRRWRKSLIQTWRSGEWRAFKRQVAAGRYDLIIDAQGLLKSAVLTRLNAAPVAGYDRSSAREPMASKFYRHRYHVEKQQHAVERTRLLFAQALGYRSPSSLGEYALDWVRLPAAKPPGNSFVIFCHGTTWQTKLWPEEYWRTLAGLANAAGYEVLLPRGNDEELSRAERIAAGLPRTRVLPKSGIGEIASLMAQSDGVVCVDTGLGHLAAALAVPTVALYGPTSPVLTGNYGRNQTVLASTIDCAPCLSKSCLVQPQKPADGSAWPPCFQRLPPERVWSEFMAAQRAVR